MGLYGKNIENLKIHKRYLWDAIEQSEIEETGISVYSKEARDGNSALYIEKNEKEYRLNSAYRPLEEAKKWAEQYEFPHMNAVGILFGLGNGYLLRELMKRGAYNTNFIVYEPNREVLLHILEQYDISDLILSRQLIIAANESMFFQALHQWVTMDNIEINQVCIHPQYQELFPEQQVVFLRSIRDSSTLAITEKNTERILGKKTVLNVLHALKKLPKSYFISDLKKLAETGAPAYIVAAGPSLDKNIQELKQAKGHGVIVAVDKAIVFLMAAGVEPDFLVLEDAAKNTYYFAKEEVKKLPLLACMSANAAIVKEQKGEVYYYSSLDYTDELVSQLGYTDAILKTGGSVATAACSICARMGFQTIVFVGQDLSYGENGATHTGGFVLGEQSQGELRYEVDGVYGEKVKTRNDWYIFLKWYEGEIQEYPQICFLDATEGGAKIAGTEIITLKEVVDNYKEININCADIMKQNKKHPDQECLEMLHGILEKDKKDLEWIEKAMEKAEKAMTKLIQACENRSILTTSYAGMLKEVGEINEKAAKLPVSSLLNSYVAAEAQTVTAGLNRLSGDELKNKEKIYEQSRSLYQVMKKGAAELRNEMNW